MASVWIFETNGTFSPPRLLPSSTRSPAALRRGVTAPPHTAAVTTVPAKEEAPPPSSASGERQNVAPRLWKKMTNLVMGQRYRALNSVSQTSAFETSFLLFFI